MERINSMKHPNIIFNLFALSCFVLCPMAQAVSPPPDGGYAGGNTAEGQNSLFSLIFLFGFLRDWIRA